MDFKRARAKVEADLHKFLESDCRTESEWITAAVCYLKTVTEGLIAECLRPDTPDDPYEAVSAFRENISYTIDCLYRRELGAQTFIQDFNYGGRSRDLKLSFEWAVRTCE